MFLKPRLRNSMASLFPLVRKTRPRRCDISGETEKHQTPYPPPWMNEHKDFNKAKKYPLEIDHIDGLEYRGLTSNLRWLTKLAHIERTNLQMFPYRRPVRKGAPSRNVGNKFSWE